MFYLEKFVRMLIELPVLLTICFILAALLRYRNSKAAWPLTATLLLLVWILSTKPGVILMTAPLVAGLHEADTGTLPAIADIVVLGGGCRRQSGHSTAEKLSDPSLRRTLEGYRIWSRLPGSTLILTGIDWQRHCNTAGIAKQLISSWSADTTRIRLLNPVFNTRQEARAYVSSNGTGRPVILVTSAIHMPRALRNFRRQNITVTAAPTDFPVSDTCIRLSDLIPQSNAFSTSSAAWIEWIALLTGK